MPGGYSLIWAIWVCAAPKGLGVSAVLVIDRALMLAMFGLKIGYGFSTLVWKYWVTTAMVINWVSNFTTLNSTHLEYYFQR